MKYSIENDRRAAAKTEWMRANGRALRERTITLPSDLEPLPSFRHWINEAVHDAIRGGMVVPQNVQDLARGPSQYARTITSCWATDRHFRIARLDANRITTSDKGVGAMYWQHSISGPRDMEPVRSKMEYFGYLEEIVTNNKTS